MATPSLKKADLKSDWFLIDATDLVLGRLAVQIANMLRGKHKPQYTPHMDGGDNIVVINASKIALTGHKADRDNFYWHSGFPGGIKSRTKGELLANKPEELLFNAVKRMMGRRRSTALADQRLTKLHIYAGAEHKHKAQNPVVFDFGSANVKNKRGE